jgi:hypothetical protein
LTASGGQVYEVPLPGERELEEDLMARMMLVLAALALVLSAAACKKSDAEAAADICNHKSKCEKAETPTPATIEGCKAGLADKDCGAQTRAMIECMIAKESCTPDGLPDLEAMMNGCGEQFGSYMECMKNKHPPPAP